MSRYSISATDKVHAAEFRTNLATGNAYHSPGLQRVLNVMRTGPKAGKYVLVVQKPFACFVLARLPASRGEALEILEDCRFDDPREAEWAVFRRRWHEHTGEPLDALPESLRH